MRKIKGIIIHCTATRPEWWEGKRTSEKVAEIRRWHVTPKPGGRGWSDIGYHFLIDRDGTVAKGRDLSRTGAHVAGHNTGTIGVSLFGGHGSAETDQFAEHFTQAQDKALRSLLHDLQRQFGENISITGHNQYAAKACPGFNVPEYMKQTRPQFAPHVDTPAKKSPAKKSQPKMNWLAMLLALFKGKGKK